MIVRFGLELDRLLPTKPVNNRGHPIFRTG